MPDRITAEQRSANMRAIRSRDTAPEIVVRKLLHRLGYRFRVHAKDLPGKPDVVFRGRKKAVFVHGCFWHQHDDPGCSDARKPKSNTQYWTGKLLRNRERDAQHLRSLASLGWEVAVVWDCETRDAAGLSERLRQFLGEPRAAR